MSDSEVSKPGVHIKEVENLGMISVKADFTNRSIRALVEATLDLKYPSVGRITLGKKAKVCWMSTDECLIMTDLPNTEKLAYKINRKLKGQHYLCVDMSDSRSCFEISGDGWREILAKGSPADISPEHFTIGMFRRTRLGNLAVACWITNTDSARLLCMRSVGDFVEKWLQNAIQESSRVSFFSDV